MDQALSSLMRTAVGDFPLGDLTRGETRQLRRLRIMIDRMHYLRVADRSNRKKVLALMLRAERMIKDHALIPRMTLRALEDGIAETLDQIARTKGFRFGPLYGDEAHLGFWFEEMLEKQT